MSLFVALIALSSVYVGQNKQLEDSYKFGFFGVIIVISLIVIAFGLLSN
jgi:hypothetical protein